MAASEEDICNSALLRIGAASISSLSDETPEAVACNAQFPKVKKELLRAHPWKFAKKREVLEPDEDPPEWGWSARYEVPASSVRILEMQGQENGYAWTVEDGFLLNNVGGDIGVVYIDGDTVVTKFDSAFDEAFAAELAYVLSFSMVQSVSFREELRKEAVKKLQEARSFNGQEGAGDRVYSDSWLNSRA